MKIALIALARDENPYAEEWLDYHFRLGVDDAYLVQHAGWRYDGRSFPGLHRCTAGLKSKQRDVVNDWLGECRSDYDWALLIDLDEFICLKNGDASLKDFLARYDYANGICLNWRYFGDSGRTEDGDYRIVERFTRCQRGLDGWVKQAVHLSRAPKNTWMADVHTPMLGMDTRATIAILPEVYNVSGRHCQTKLSVNYDDLGECLDIAWLAHYRTKTYGEWIRRIDKNIGYYLESDTRGWEDLYARFYEYNHNETEELSLRNFQRTGRFLA